MYVCVVGMIALHEVQLGAREVRLQSWQDLSRLLHTVRNMVVAAARLERRLAEVDTPFTPLSSRKYHHCHHHLEHNPRISQRLPSNSRAV